MFKPGDRIRIKKEFEGKLGGPDSGTVVREYSNGGFDEVRWWVKWDSSGNELHIEEDGIELIPENLHLKYKLEAIGFKVYFQVLHQSNAVTEFLVTRQVNLNGFDIRSFEFPEISTSVIALRGNANECDSEIDSLNFDTAAEAARFVERVKVALNMLVANVKIQELSEDALRVFKANTSNEVSL